MRYVFHEGKVVPEHEVPRPKKARSRVAAPAVQAKRTIECFLSRSRPRAIKDANGAWVKPHGVEHVNKVGQPIFTSRQQVREHCAAASDNDYETVTYDG
jgi:hypothetical protein